MKLAATIFSWLGGAVTAAELAVFFSFGYIYLYMEYAGNGKWEYAYTIIPFPWYIWIIYGIDVAIMLAILIWRQYSVSQGRKVACGIITLIFCGLIGGILTLLIPERDLYGLPSKSNINENQGNNLTSLKELDEHERLLILEDYRKKYDQGLISKKEYIDKKRELFPDE